MAKYTKLSIHKVYNENPFLGDLIGVPIKQKKVFSGKADNIIVNGEGEITGHSAFLSIREVDAQQFVKVFTEGIKSLYELSKAEHKLFYYILSITRPNTDWIYFDMEDAKEFTGYKSKAAILSALSKLVSKSIIAISRKRNIYYINPTIFFNGNRVSFIKSVVLKSKKNDTIESSEEQRKIAIKSLSEDMKK